MRLRCTPPWPGAREPDTSAQVTRLLLRLHYVGCDRQSGWPASLTEAPRTDVRSDFAISTAATPGDVSGLCILAQASIRQCRQSSVDHRKSGRAHSPETGHKMDTLAGVLPEEGQDGPMRSKLLALSIMATVGISGCSPPANQVLVEGGTVQLVDGYYNFSLLKCSGANTFIISAHVGPGSEIKHEFGTSPTKPSDQGHMWFQAGTYSGESLNEVVAPCFGLCMAQITSSHELKGCGWSLRLSLVRTGNR